MVKAFEGHSTHARPVAFPSNGRRAVSEADDKRVNIWNIDSGSCLEPFECHSYLLLLPPQYGEVT
jgi:WD40 repeat protein